MERTRQDIEQEADRIIAMYDEVYFRVMNAILDEVRAEANIPHTTTPNSLGQAALRALGLPKIS